MLPSSRYFLPALTAAVLALSGCGTPVSKEEILTNPHYWERSEASSAIWLRGPKAQQVLHQDIARCVSEIRELERLGSLRRAIPGDTDAAGNYPDPQTAEGGLAQWETPDRDGYLRAEFLDYHDFETCMQAKGWQRVDSVSYRMAEEAREVYIETILGQKYRTKTGERESFRTKKEEESALSAPLNE